MSDHDGTERAAWEGEMFRLLAENVLDYAIFVVDPHRHVLSWSKGAERLLGFSEEEIVGKQCDRFFTPEDVAAGVPQKELDGALRTGRGDDDRWHVRKDGTRFWASGVVTPLRDEGGRLRGFAKIMRDRTDLKRAQDELADALAYAEAVVATVREPLLVLDGGLRVRTANRSFYRTFRVTPGETEGQPLYELGNGQWDVPALRRLLGEILPRDAAFDGFEVEHQFPHIGRKVMLLNARKLRREGSHTELILLAVEDVTALREAEATRRDAEARFTEMVKNVRDHSIFLTDANGVITSWNVAAERIIGYSEAEAVGKHFSLIFTPEDVAAGVPETELRQAREEGRAEDERWHRRKDGSLFWALGVVTPLHDPAGRLSGYSKILRDMTDWKRAEEELAASRGRLQALFDHSLDAILLADDDARYVDANPAASALLGYGRDELLSRGVFDVTPPPDAEAGRAAWAAFVGGGHQSGEYALARKDGSTAVVEYRAVANVQPGLHLSVLRDVTDRRRTEEALKGSRERLVAALDASGTGTFRWDPATGEFLDFDDRLKRLFGFGPGEAVRTTEDFLARVHPDDAAGLRAAVAACREGADFEMEYRVVLPGGEVRWLYDRAGVVRAGDGGPPYLVGACTDITPLKRAETELAHLTAESERRKRLYETILANTPDLAYVFDLDHRFTYANEVLLRMWGKTWDEAIGKTCLELGYEPWHAAMHDREIEEVKATKKPIRGEVPFAGTFGRRIYDYIFVPVLGPTGEVEAVAGTTRDVTERKAMEDELRRVASELSEAGRRKDDFLATLAHELRNPLAPLRNGVQILRLSRGDAGAIDRSLGMMERQLAQMVHLIDDLLDVSRITRGKLQLRPQRVELAAVVQAAVETARPLVEANAHRLSVTLPPEPLHLEADPTRLAQVLSNLLTNAAKYTERGGDISLAARREGGGVVVSVRDTGIGISPDHLTRLFEMFSQVDSALDRSQGGLGIGLALVKGLVEMHGGTVEAKSEGPGRGSEFLVRLPAPGHTDAVPAAGPPDAVPATAARPRLRVLVADDNRDAADSLAEVLRLAGHEVLAARDGREAVDAAGWFRPDVALLDIGMPRLNGYEAARQIRREEWGRGVVLVALTGWGQEESRRRAKEAGFDHHLTKPVDPAELEKLLAGLAPRK